MVKKWYILIATLIICGLGFGLGFGLTGGGGGGGVATSQWVYVAHMPVGPGDDIYDGTVTWTLSGEEECCYVLDWTFDPPIVHEVEDVTVSIDSARIWEDRDTLVDIRMEMYGILTGGEETLDWKMVSTCEAEVEGYLLKELGNEFTVTTTTTMSLYLNGWLVGEPWTEEEISYGIIEEIGDVTVPAGTFESVKMASYADEAHTVLESEVWLVADTEGAQMPWMVKVIGYEDGTPVMTMELQSYSI